jgi:phage baseplate assembly protein W
LQWHHKENEMLGYTYPFRYDTTGAPVENAEDAELVASAVTQFLSQMAGERPYQKGNGHRLDRYVFENESELVKANARRHLFLGLTRHEPRIEVVEVIARYLQQGSARVLEVTVVWRYKGKVYSTGRNISLEG